MKAKHSILLLALGFCLEFAGSFSRILHRGDATLLLLVATILKVLGILLLAYKIITYEGFRRFMER